MQEKIWCGIVYWERKPVSGDPPTEIYNPWQRPKSLLSSTSKIFHTSSKLVFFLIIFIIVLGMSAIIELKRFRQRTPFSGYVVTTDFHMASFLFRAPFTRVAPHYLERGRRPEQIHTRRSVNWTHQKLHLMPKGQPQPTRLWIDSTYWICILDNKRFHLSFELAPVCDELIRSINLLKSKFRHSWKICRCV